MKQIPIKLGPIALLLTVISICLTVMTILTFSTAQADRAMAQRYADSVQTRYALEASGQRFLQEADQALAAGGQLSDLADTAAAGEGIEKIIEEDGYTLTIRLEPDEEGYQVALWKLDKEWKQRQDLNIWQGF